MFISLVSVLKKHIHVMIYDFELAFIIDYINYGGNNYWAYASSVGK